jgi:hypothetical protein
MGVMTERNGCGTCRQRGGGYSLNAPCACAVGDGCFCDDDVDATTTGWNGEDGMGVLVWSNLSRSHTNDGWKSARLSAASGKSLLEAGAGPGVMQSRDEV